jgi:hypothetical protein
VIGVGARGQIINQLEVVRAEDLARAIGSIGHEQFVEFSGVKNALRLALAWDGRDALDRRQVKDFYRVLIVAEGRYEHSFALYVHAKVVQAALHVWHRDRLHKFERAILSAQWKDGR